MVEGLDVGGIRYVITYGNGAYTIQGAKIYMNYPGLPFYTYMYMGATDAYGVLNVPNIPTGTSKYMVSKTGFVTATGSLVVVGGHTTYKSIDMVQSLSMSALATGGSLNIVSNPAGACISIDEAVQNTTTPVTIADIPQGDHVLILSKDGYSDYNTLITIVNGQTTTISANLIPL